MQQLLHSLNSNTGYEFCIKSYDGWKLTLYSGMSLEYARPIASFVGVSYISCASEFQHATFRLASDSERQEVGTLVPLDTEDWVVAIEAETMANRGRQLFLLAVSGLELPSCG